MDELVSQNAALESRIAESTAAAAAQKPDMEAEPELVMEPQPEEVMEPEADFSMRIHRRRNCPL